jgi:hypothetical protein
MNPNPTRNQSIPFPVRCKVESIDGTLHLTGTFAVRYDIASSASELDDIIDLADHIGQVLKQQSALAALEYADQQAARLAQEVAPHLHKHGTRPFTLITPYGRLKMQRQRLLDPKTGKPFIPSAILWKTKQNRHIVSALARSACETVQNISYRKSQQSLSETAHVDSLLSHSTVWNLKQDEEQRLETMQQQVVERVLKEHRETLDKHGLLPPPSEPSADEGNTEEITTEEEAEIEALYQYFTAEPHKNESESDGESMPKEMEGKRCPRHVPADTILLQADEVVTKSQESGRKTNKTFTATLESGWGQCEYLASRSSESLQILVAVILVLWGLFSGKKLEVISDGAAWIRLWIGRLIGVEVYHLLCWYHLCKRVYEGLSGLGATKEERELWQRKILGFLWKGNVDDAVEAMKSLLPRCRVRSRVEELIDYVLRKRSWIGDYEGRQAAGLWIASTRVEKWNDVAVSERCKHRSMSWTESGVLAMALHAAAAKRNNTPAAKRNAKNHTTL